MSRVSTKSSILEHLVGIVTCCFRRQSFMSLFKPPAEFGKAFKFQSMPVRLKSPTITILAFECFRQSLRIWLNNSRVSEVELLGERLYTANYVTRKGAVRTVHHTLSQSDVLCGNVAGFRHSFTYRMVPPPRLPAALSCRNGIYPGISTIWLRISLVSTHSSQVTPNSSQVTPNSSQVTQNPYLVHLK